MLLAALFHLCRRLLDRQQQFELQKMKILASNSESKEEDITLLEEDLLPPADKATVKKIQAAFARLDLVFAWVYVHVASKWPE